MPRDGALLQAFVSSWRGSSARRKIRRAILEVLALNTPQPHGLTHVFLHDISEDKAKCFEMLLDALLERGPIVSFGDAFRRRPVEGPAFTLSFDDGYRSTVLTAGRILAKRRIPAAIFVPVGFVGLTGEPLRRFMVEGLRWRTVIEPATAHDLRWCAENGIALESHGVTHRDFATLPADEARQELIESRNRLEAISGKPVRYFAWPFGQLRHFRPEYVRLAAECGYDKVFSAVPRVELDDPRWAGVVSRRELSLEWGVRVCRYFAMRG